MARKQNGLVMQNTIEPTLSAPLDARQQVKLLSDLTDPASYPYSYVGMVVGVKENAKIYVLTAKDTTDASNWKRLLTEGDIGDGPENTINLAEYAKIAQIPVNITDLANNAGFLSDTEIDTKIGASAQELRATIDQIQEDLSNYYKKEETYSKDEVDGIIATINSLDIVAVPTLPTSNVRTDCIYLVKDSLVDNNLYSEWIYLGDGDEQGWEKFGSANLDLSDYVTTDELNSAIQNLATTQYVDDAIDAAFENATEITAEEVAALFG